jgi:hypothetical protein
MAKIIYKQRWYGSYKYTTCQICKAEFKIEQPIRLSIPYCNNCNKIILDCAQTYCGWCGVRLESEGEKG